MTGQDAACWLIALLPVGLVGLVVAMGLGIIDGEWDHYQDSGQADADRRERERREAWRRKVRGEDNDGEGSER